MRARHCGCVVIALALFACTTRRTDPPSETRATSAPPSPPAPSPPPTDTGLALEAPSPPPTDTGVNTRLFASEVATDSLPLSLAIETVGGVSLVVIPRGTPLPARFTDTFSTAADGQSSVELHMILGERPRARDNRDLGRFQLTGIPSAQTGTAHIEVTFEVDRTGVLTVSAVDAATKASRTFRFDGVAGPALDQRMVDRMLAEANASQLVDSRARLDNQIYHGRKLLADAGRLLSHGDRARLESALRDAERLRTSNEVSTLSQALARLQGTYNDVTDTLRRPAKH